MNENIDIDLLNKISLKPRFSIERHEDATTIIEKFKKEFGQSGGKFSGKIVDSHIIVDVPTKEAHFWSPQLHAEIISQKEDSTIVKGMFGPKPTVWSLFMFIHFGVAIAFLVFVVLWYVRWSLQQDYQFEVIMCTLMPIGWFSLYFLGRIGKRKGSKQMYELRCYFLETLER